MYFSWVVAALFILTSIHHTVHWFSSEIWSVSLNGVRVLQDLHKLAVLKYMYAADGGEAHWRQCAAYLNSGNVDRMIR